MKVSELKNKASNVENNKKIGNSILYGYKIYIRYGQEITSNRQNISEKLIFFLLKF